jgi:hypothetical protein
LAEECVEGDDRKWIDAELDTGRGKGCIVLAKTQVTPLDDKLLKKGKIENDTTPSTVRLFPK